MCGVHPGFEVASTPAPPVAMSSSFACSTAWDISRCATEWSPAAPRQRSGIRICRSRTPGSRRGSPAAPRGYPARPQGTSILHVASASTVPSPPRTVAPPRTRARPAPLRRPPPPAARAGSCRRSRHRRRRSRWDSSGAALRVQFQDPIHPHQHDDNAAERRHGGPRGPGARASRHDRGGALGRDTDAVGHPGGGLGDHGHVYPLALDCGVGLVRDRSSGQSSTCAAPAPLGARAHATSEASGGVTATRCAFGPGV